MNAERRARYLAEADRAIAEGDNETARIVLDLVAYADRYEEPGR